MLVIDISRFTTTGDTIKRDLMPIFGDMIGIGKRYAGLTCDRIHSVSNVEPRGASSPKDGRPGEDLGR